MSKFQVVATADPLARTMALLDAYLAAPNDADIEVRIGSTEHGEPAIHFSINAQGFSVTAAEANALADIAESALHEYPHSPEAVGLPNFILALRHGAAAAMKASQ